MTKEDIIYRLAEISETISYNEMLYYLSEEIDDIICDIERL